METRLKDDISGKISDMKICKTTIYIIFFTKYEHRSKMNVKYNNNNILRI